MSEIGGASFDWVNSHSAVTRTLLRVIGGQDAVRARARARARWPALHILDGGGLAKANADHTHHVLRLSILPKLCVEGSFLFRKK